MTAGRPRLRPGSRVAVVSPASGASAERVRAGLARLAAWGYDPVLMPHALDRGPLYYAGTTADRVADLHAAFADPTIDGILCTRGGWGSAELLPFLDRELIQANPKVFVGYSDHTSLQTWLWNECHLQTFYAPMVAADWADENGVDERSWRAAVESSGEYTLGICGTNVNDDRAAVKAAQPGSAGGTDGLRVLRAGRARGRLLGGCLAILEAGLGTPWALRVHEPVVLFLEDTGVKPYQWDRMLQHLRFAGLMEQVTGVVFGDTVANVGAGDNDHLEAACLHALRDFKGPVAIGLRCGHVSGGNRSLVLGAMAELQCADGAMLRVGLHEGDVPRRAAGPVTAPIALQNGDPKSPDGFGI